MLYLQTVEPRTFAILERLQHIPQLQKFYLVGGTALSLKYGHRTSIDLDFFGQLAFDKQEIINALQKEFGNDLVYEQHAAQWAVFCFIQNIKIDIVKYDHPIIFPVEIVDNIRMYSIPDIAAMKVNAILGRGKKKDFWDIYELLHEYTIDNLIDFYNKKFPTQQLLISIPSAMTYFQDAEETEEPVSLKGQNWKMIKNYIQRKVSDYLR
jgi:predicted nucleotidyltransferase component of viral defense system